MEGQPRHRPPRRFPDAERRILECPWERCLHCGEALIFRKPWHMHKYVQTLQGPLFVAGRSKACGNPGCSHPGMHYYASQALRISLPYSTYGLDVLAYIGWQHEQEHRQLVEIQRALQARGILINERNVGKLYRQFLALLGGMEEQKRERVARSAQVQGGVVWAMDALQPEGEGALLYVLYEALSETVVSAMQKGYPTVEELRVWLEPYAGWGGPVLATLSDGEERIMIALKQCWPEAPHQRCQTHFLNAVAEPVLEVDTRLRQQLREDLGRLPPVPEQAEASGPTPRQATESPLCLSDGMRP